MLLSIIIPVYNAGEKVRACLDSISRLRETELEVIIINDGSTDNTQKYLDEYKQKDSRFKFYEKKNSGVSDTRNLGLTLCTGKYVTFIDGDDTVTEEYNQIIDIVKGKEYDLYNFDLTICNGDKRSVLKKNHLKNGENNRQTLMKALFAGSSNSVCTNIYKTDVIRTEQILFSKAVKMGEDLLFNATYFQQVDNAYYINLAPYVYYVDNQGSAMHIKKLSYLDDYIKIYDELADIRNKYEEVEINKANYLLQIYEVLRFQGKIMSKEQEDRLRGSLLFGELMKETFRGEWKLIIKKFMLRLCLYRIWIP